MLENIHIDRKNQSIAIELSDVGDIEKFRLLVPGQELSHYELPSIHNIRRPQLIVHADPDIPAIILKPSWKPGEYTLFYEDLSALLDTLAGKHGREEHALIAKKQLLEARAYIRETLPTFNTLFHPDAKCPTLIAEFQFGEVVLYFNQDHPDFDVTKAKEILAALRRFAPGRAREDNLSFQLDGCDLEDADAMVKVLQFYKLVSDESREQFTEELRTAQIRHFSICELHAVQIEVRNRMAKAGLALADSSSNVLALTTTYGELATVYDADTVRRNAPYLRILASLASDGNFRSIPFEDLALMEVIAEGGERWCPPDKGLQSRMLIEEIASIAGREQGFEFICTKWLPEIKIAIEHHKQADATMWNSDGKPLDSKLVLSQQILPEDPVRRAAFIAKRNPDTGKNMIDLWAEAGALNLIESAFAPLAQTPSDQAKLVAEYLQEMGLGSYGRRKPVFDSLITNPDAMRVAVRAIAGVGKSELIAPLTKHFMFRNFDALCMFADEITDSKGREVFLHSIRQYYEQGNAITDDLGLRPEGGDLTPFDTPAKMAKLEKIIAVGEKHPDFFGSILHTDYLLIPAIIINGRRDLLDSAINMLAPNPRTESWRNEPQDLASAVLGYSGLGNIIRYSQEALSTYRIPYAAQAIDTLYILSTALAALQKAGNIEVIRHISEEIEEARKSRQAQAVVLARPLEQAAALYSAATNIAPGTTIASPPVAEPSIKRARG